MPNKNYLRGRRLEWQVKKDLEGRGWHVLRTAGSHGAYDLVGIKDIPNEVLWMKFIQCKVVAKLTDSILNKLKKELKTSSPISAELDSSRIVVDVLLYVKVQGTKNYEVYPLES